MMKNLKFRAYDPESGMIYQSNLIKFHISGNGMWIVSDHAGKVPAGCGTGKIMQFTGLKDRNGKEIYGGDILKNQEMIYIVYFDLGAFLVKMKLYPENRIELMQIYKYAEIIGNIFENSELLGDSNENNKNG
uniref:Putative YopX protein n=1 Tax=viral metagenome TaxID=1070528 RepID=A0A6M3JLL8_9ZZZZ